MKEYLPETASQTAGPYVHIGLAPDAAGFHIFEKNFWCFGRNAGTYNMNTRLHTLLGYVEMQDRMIAPEDLKNKTHCIQINIDLHSLEKKQKESIAFLSNALEIL